LGVRFLFPHFPAEFEIPDDWWIEAGMSDFACQSEAYNGCPPEITAMAFAVLKAFSTPFS
jgi:hypothetical protein